MRIEILDFKNFYGPEARFKDRQKTFEIAADRVVQWGAQTITNTPQNRDDIALLFARILTGFSIERRRLAEEAGSLNPEEFGQTYEESGGTCFSYTPLVGRYEEANAETLARLYKELDPLKRTKMQFLETEKKVSEVVLNRQFSWDYKILSGKDLQKLKWDQPPSIEQQRKIQGELKRHIHSKSPTPEELSCAISAYQKKFPEDYAQEKMLYFLTFLNQVFPSPYDPNAYIHNPAYLKSEYILVSMNTEINGKMVPTNQLLTWCYTNFQQDPLERMVQHSKLFILHQDAHRRSASLAECARLFTEIIETGKSLEENELKEKMALFRYIFAHGNPFIRGSSAIGEWLEKAIYQHLGFSCEQPKGNSTETIDVFALTALSFAEYLRKYHEAIRIAPIKEQTDSLLRLRMLS